MLSELLLFPYLELAFYPWNMPSCGVIFPSNWHKIQYLTLTPFSPESHLLGLRHPWDVQNLSERIIVAGHMDKQTCSVINSPWYPV